MIRRILMIVSMLVLQSILFSTTAFAINPFEDVCQNQSNAVCSTPITNPVSGSDSLVTKIANIISVAGGVIAVIFIMIAGLTMVTSSGDTKKVTEARDTAIYASIGIVVIVLARTILAFITRYIT